MQSVTPQEKPEEKGNGIGIIILNVFLAIITILLLGYIAYKNGYINLDNILNLKQTEETQENDTEEESDQTEESTMDIFDGEYISAITPDDWSIQEYEDGDGTDMLVEGVTYTGLTGIKIFKGDEKVMEIGAVSGIGFVGCSELALFDDSNPEYNQDQKDMNDEVGMELNTVDYTDTEYSEFVFLGKEMRRINNDLYYDTENDNSYFEPQCEKGFMTLTGISFVDSYEYEGYAYYFKITEETAEVDLTILDSILASITIN